jgi:rod shape-determining protein MreC
VKKFNPNKNIIITLILVIIVVTILSMTIAKRAAMEKKSVVSSAANDTVSLVDRVVFAPVKWFENGVDAVQNLFVTYEENERLKEKLDAYDALAQENENHKREIETLTNELELNQTLTSFEKTTANVITRSPDTWQDILVVDKGSKDGIEPNMAVMAQHGLVGRVIEVNGFSSKVELLTSENQTSNHYPVRISTDKGEAFGVLKGYDTKEKLFIVEQVTGETNVKKGDVVQTSGLGENSPADLLVGKVVDAQVDKFGLDKKVFVQPTTNTHDLSVVTIVERKVGEKP